MLTVGITARPSNAEIILYETGAWPHTFVVIMAAFRQDWIDHFKIFPAGAVLKIQTESILVSYRIAASRRSFTVLRG